MNSLAYCVLYMLIIANVQNRYVMCGSTLKTKIYEVATGIHYEYVYVKANSNGTHFKPTLLFLHGFPSSFHCWQNQIEYFSRQGYGSLAPNMMGYGKTYSPLNKTEYRAKSMVNHLIALLDYLKIDKVFVIGHDWGTRSASRFALYYPERTLGLVLISIGYDQPSMFDLDQALKNTKEACGLELFGYWQFFSSDDAAKIIENNLESFIDILYSSNTTLFITDFAPVGKLREWLINKKRTDRASYMTTNDYKIVRKYLAHGMQPKLNWYKAAIDNVNWEDEKNIDPVIRQPFLFIQDAISNICLGSSLVKQRQFTPNSNVITLDTWHWVMQENPDAVNRAINEWIRKII